MKLLEIATDKLQEQLDWIAHNIQILDLRDNDVTDMEWDSIKKQLKDHNAIGFPGRVIRYGSGIAYDVLKPAPFDVLECFELSIRQISILDFSSLPKKINGGIYIRKSILDIPKFIDYLEELPSDKTEIYMSNCSLHVDDVYRMLDTKYRFRINFDEDKTGYRVFKDVNTGKIRIIELGGTKIIDFDSVFELQEWFVDRNITVLN
ncbi:hypothetical protein RsoM2USA_265 [Ralstonia phage RsoM2USA]|nr:hypothetical protein RsoM2USA_265 [Ralstonia phage RsoM2USA]